MCVGNGKLYYKLQEINWLSCNLPKNANKNMQILKLTKYRNIIFFSETHLPFFIFCKIRLDFRKYSQKVTKTETKFLNNVFKLIVFVSTVWNKYFVFCNI